MHFCQLHTFVNHWQLSKMNEPQGSDDEHGYELKNAIQELPRDLQIRIFKYFYYHPVTLSIDTNQTNLVKISIPHLYMNIDYVKEQVKICTGLPKENQSYFYGRALIIYPDKNFINYNIIHGTILKNFHSWERLDIIWRFGLSAWE